MDNRSRCGKLPNLNWLHTTKDNNKRKRAAVARAIGLLLGPLCQWGSDVPPNSGYFFQFAGRRTRHTPPSIVAQRTSNLHQTAQRGSCGTKSPPDREPTRSSMTNSWLFSIQIPIVTRRKAKRTSKLEGKKSRWTKTDKRQFRDPILG